ncbi:MAG: polysaccharide deacetylase [Eubacterium sp.]|nr:polysaccharide deacetylase [Eubacterium sp.]
MTGDTVGKISEEYRKKRVKRIKRIIIGLLLFMLILPTALCVFLFIKVENLQSRLDEIMPSGAPAVTSSAVSEEKSSTEKPTVTAKPTDAPEQTADESEGNGKKVYLTFEDSPSTQTKKILKILKNNDVKATFFVNGKSDDYSVKMYKQIVDDGHTLGMHSYSHVFDEIYASKKAFEADLEKLSDYLYETTGVRSKFYRFPGGSGVQGTKAKMKDLIEVLDDHDVTYLDWNVLSPDIKDASVPRKKMIKQIEKEIGKYDTSVVAFYDSKTQPMTIEALPSIIKYLKENGYEILPVDENTAPIRHNQ